MAKVSWIYSIEDNATLTIINIKIDSKGRAVSINFQGVTGRSATSSKRSDAYDCDLFLKKMGEISL
jgi:hypothetical protein